MKRDRRMWIAAGRVVFAAALACFAAFAQQSAQMPAGKAIPFFARCVQLMEASTVAIPELNRAGAPVIENARQAVGTIQETPGRDHAGLTYTFLINVRAYLALADAVPKPFPFPEEAARQISELRDAANRVESHFRALLDAKESRLRTPDRDNLRRYAEANASIGAPRPGKHRVVFLGDSITDGWRINEYFADRDFVNRGISGQITGEMLGRMKADVIDLKPSAVLILAGTNDLARGVSLAAIQNNLTMIADLADANRIKPIFASILPISDYHKDKDPNYLQSTRRPPAQILTMNTWLAAFCKSRRYTYLDYFSKLVDQHGFLKADAADDGLHPNSVGYRIMAPLALAAIDKTLGAARAAAQPAESKR